VDAIPSLAQGARSIHSSIMFAALFSTTHEKEPPIPPTDILVLAEH
jgi:hypothetical protein